MRWGIGRARAGDVAAGDAAIDAAASAGERLIHTLSRLDADVLHYLSPLGPLSAYEPRKRLGRHRVQVESLIRKALARVRQWVAPSCHGVLSSV